VSTELLRCLQEWADASLGLIREAGRPLGTASFIASSGLAVTCRHVVLYADPAQLEVCWGRHPRHACPVRAIHEHPTLDIALLEVERGDDHAPAPVLPVARLVRARSILYHEAVALGFAGAGSDGITIAPRCFAGSITLAGDEAEPWRLETLDLGIAPVNSGGPIFDLEVQRFVALVQTSPDRYRPSEAASVEGSSLRAIQRMGTAVLLEPLLEAHPELAEEWQAAAVRLDQVLVSRLGRDGVWQGGARPQPALHRRLLVSRLSHAVARHARLSGFATGGSVRRVIEDHVLAILDRGQHPFTLLAGPADAGKTFLLLRLVPAMQDRGWLPVLIPGSSVRDGDLTAEIAAAIAPRHDAGTSLLESLGSLGQAGGVNGSSSCSSSAEGHIVVILDGLDQWDDLSAGRLITALQDLDEAITSGHAPGLRLLMTTRRELLDKELAELGDHGGLAHPAWSSIADRFNRDHRTGRWYLELDHPAEARYEDGATEQERMLAFFASAGRDPDRPQGQEPGPSSGESPARLSFPLPETLAQVLDRPRFIKLLAERADDLQALATPPGTSFLQAAAQLTLLQAAGGDSLVADFLADLLAELAARSFSSNDGPGLEHAIDLSSLPIEQVSVLVHRTPVLVHHPPADPLAAGRVSFTSELFLELYLGRHLWRERVKAAANDDPAPLLDLIEAEGAGRRGRALTGALVFVGEWIACTSPERLPMLVRLLDAEDRHGVCRALTRSLLDHLRVSFRFEVGPSRQTSFFTLLESAMPRPDRRPAPTLDDLPADQAQGCPGARLASRMADYAEALELIAAHEDGCRVAEGALTWPALDETIRRRLHLAGALHAFLSHDIDQAEAHLAPVRHATAQAEEQAKLHFIAGRIHQFQGRWTEASREYRQATAGYFGLRGAHQLAFIHMMRTSRFDEADGMLSEVLERMQDQLPEALQQEVRLLHATCGIRIGAYERARTQLDALILARRQQGNRLRLGTALRALADLELRCCCRDAARAAADEAIVLLRGASHPLSLAYALDLSAEILVILDGELDLAMAQLDEALAVTRQHPHAASRSWMLQSRAQIEAFRGAIDGAEAALAQAARLGLSPYQHCRAAWVRALATMLGAGTAQTTQGEAAAQALRQAASGFSSLNIGWYPMLARGLATMLETASGDPAGTTSHASPEAPPPAAGVQLEPGVSREGLSRSYLWARACAAACSRSDTSPRPRH